MRISEDEGQNGDFLQTSSCPVYTRTRTCGVWYLSLRGCAHKDCPSSHQTFSSPLTRISSVETAKQHLRHLPSARQSLKLLAWTDGSENFDRSMPLQPAPKLFSLAKRAPAHRRVKLVSEPQTWNMLQKNHAYLRSPRGFCLHFFIVSYMDGSGSDINLLWASNPQIQISPTPHNLRVASYFARTSLCLNLQASVPSRPKK